MVHFETHYYIITSITTITTDFHYYIATYNSITTIIHLTNLEMEAMHLPVSLGLEIATLERRAIKISFNFSRSRQYVMLAGIEGM